MEQIVEQVIARLQAMPGEARTQSPVFQAVQSALAVAPDDLADWQRFATHPERNESAARFILKQRLASDTALLQRLRGLLGLPSGGEGRTNTANVSGNARVGVLNVGDYHGDITIGSLDFSDNKRVITAPSTPSQPARTPTTATRPPLPATLSTDGVHFSYGHALLIGVGSYKRSGLNAPKTASDAERLAALLQDPQIAAYPAAQVRVLSSSAASRQGILDALDTFATQLCDAPQPTAVLFFAGHGIKREQNYYLLPYDYDPGDLDNTAISATLFREKVAAIRQHAQKLVVLLNCCHSGGVGDSVLDPGDTGEASDTPPASFYQQLAEGSGHVVISAAKAAEKAGAVSTVTPDLTVFGAQLMAALQGEAPGDSAGIGVLDLFAFLSAQVPQDARGITYGGRPLAQHPLLYAHQVDQNFALALRPGWHGGTLDAGYAEHVARLAEFELQLAAYASESQAPTELVQRRDDLLNQLGLV